MHPISVCIIAKNEESRIERCLSSVKPYGFEIVVVDTGSTDRTKEIAAKYADQVLDFTWCDDFSAARNFSLRAASNNWIFMIDCDEAIKEIDVEELNYFRKHLSENVGSVSRENLVTENGVLTSIILTIQSAFLIKSSTTTPVSSMSSSPPSEAVISPRFCCTQLWFTQATT